MSMEYRIDLFAIFILLGIVQGLFLLFFFLSPENRKSLVNRLHSLMLISIVATILEIFLMYTGYIENILHLVDFSEAFTLMIGPSFFLLVLALIKGKVGRKQYWHFAFPFIFLFMQLPSLLMPEDYKYNAYVDAYRPDLSLKATESVYHSHFKIFTDHHTELVLLSLALYGILGLLEVVKVFRNKKESFWSPTHPVLKTLRLGAFQVISSLIIILIVKLYNKNDYGDHILAAYVSLTIYFTSFSVLRQSLFFKHTTLAEPQKYKTSGMDAEQINALVKALKDYMDKEKPYLNPGYSLPDLAAGLRVSVHQLSQVINEGLGKSFFEMLAEYRIIAAKDILAVQKHIKIEEIAEMVGYSSKSSFNTAFKKITGLTPSEYRSTL
jgi:AraC-like DNA-binding protein